MADFCKQCSIENFGEDSGDLMGLGDGKPLDFTATFAFQYWRLAE